VVHVSDILPASCLRKQYYSRRFPELDPLTDDMVHHFTKGLASEHVITSMAGIGAAQVPVVNSDIGVQGHPDLFIEKNKNHDNNNNNNNTVEDDSSVNVNFSNGEQVIIELKDTSSGERMDFKNSTFKSYLNQLLYYLVLTEVGKGILCIRHNIKELNWIKRDDKGDYYIRPSDAKPVGRVMVHHATIE
jgi:hypothetical protein